MSQLTVYQIIHTLDGEIYHLAKHLKLLFEAYYHVFSGYVKLDEAAIREQIERVMARARVPRTVSFFVRVSVSRDANVVVGEAERSLYEGYTLRCLVPRAALVHFALPLVEYPTSIRESLTQFANLEARRSACEVALREEQGRVDLINGAQIFMVTERGIVTAAVSYSVEHEVAKSAAIELGINVVERDIMAHELTLADEVFYADHHGVTAIKSCGGRFYMSITAAAIAAQMSAPAGVLSPPAGGSEQRK